MEKPRETNWNVFCPKEGPAKWEDALVLVSGQMVKENYLPWFFTIFAEENTREYMTI